MVIHISAIFSNTRKLIGVLYQKFYLYSETHTLLHLYQSLIHSHIEYGCRVWDPYLKKDIERLEGVQKFGLKVSLKQWRCGYEDLLQLANLPTLASRRQRLKLCLFDSMVNELATFQTFPLFLDPLLIIPSDQLTPAPWYSHMHVVYHLFKLLFESG